MADWLKDEALYDQERFEQRIAGLRTERGLSRREALQLLAMSVCGAAVALSGSAAAPLRALAQTADPPIVKPTPPELFRTLGTNRESVFAAFQGLGYLTPASHFFVRNHTRTPRIDAAPGDYLRRLGARAAVRANVRPAARVMSVTRIKAIECAGNGRSFFARNRDAGSRYAMAARGHQCGYGREFGSRGARAGRAEATAVDVEPEARREVGTSGNVRRPSPSRRRSTTC